MLHLQRTLGNRAVTAILHARAGAAPVTVQRVKLADFLKPQGGDFEDFEQHYSERDEDDYDQEEIGQFRESAKDYFGVDADEMDEEKVAELIMGIHEDAQRYRNTYMKGSNKKAKQKLPDAVKMLGYIHTRLRLINIAIHQRVPKEHHKAFSYRSDRITQMLAQE